MDHIPSYISLGWMLITFLTIGLLYRAARRARAVLLISLLWLLIQGAIAATGFYTETDGLPPRFTLAVLFPFSLIAVLFAAPAGRRFLDNLDPKALTQLHIVRMPVELGLYGLYLHGAIPELMTFSGRNFDILSGITAVFVAFAGTTHTRIGRNLLLGWNIACLALLFNIVIHAILSAPFPFQSLAFGQPNRAVLYFPYIWLPGYIVPVVLLAHLASLRQLIRLRPAA